ncbi:MAG: hypothetical protein MHM6MM_001534 [Cercozoa sp. M6MM]
MLPRKDASQNGSKHYSNGEIDLVSALLDAGFHPDSGTLQQSVAGASVRVRGQWRDALCEAISHEVKTITHVLSHPCGHLSADVATRVASFTALRLRKWCTQPCWKQLLTVMVGRKTRFVLCLIRRRAYQASQSRVSFRVPVS